MFDSGGGIGGGGGGGGCGCDDFGSTSLILHSIVGGKGGGGGGGGIGLLQFTDDAVGDEGGSPLLLERGGVNGGAGVGGPSGDELQGYSLL